MNLVKDFFSFAEAQDINKEDIFMQKGDQYTIVSFGEEAEHDVVYNITLVLYDNDSTVEIYIRKYIDTSNLLEVLEKTNKLNAEYLGVSFFVEDSIISTKAVCEVEGDIEIALRVMVKNMQIAATEFVNFK